MKILCAFMRQMWAFATQINQRGKICYLFFLLKNLYSSQKLFVMKKKKSIWQVKKIGCEN